MKKSFKILWALLVMAAIVFIGCDGDSDDGDKKGEEPPVPVEGLADWHIALGDANSWAGTLNIDGAKDGTNGFLRVKWGSSDDFKMCEVYALLPAEDWGAYDGLTYKVKTDAGEGINILEVLRIPSGGTTIKIKEDAAEKGGWETIYHPFSGGTEPGWGQPLILSGANQKSVKQWLTDTATTAKQINLNPAVNSYAGSSAGTAMVTYFDDIGFYKGTTGSAPTETRIVWSFDIIE